MKNHSLAKHVADASFYELKRQLSYKAVERGGQVIEIDTFFPSSKQCRKCGHKKENLSLSERVYQCESQACYHVEDRDLHASRNILKEGLRLFRMNASVEIPRAEGKSTPVKRKTATRPSSESLASLLDEAGSKNCEILHRKNPSRNTPAGLHDQI